MERKKFGEMLEEEDRKGTVFRVSKQIVRKNEDVVGGGCVNVTDDKIVVEEKKLMKIWRKYYDKLSNEEFPWNKDGLGGGGCSEWTH